MPGTISPGTTLPVMCCGEIEPAAIAALLGRFGAVAIRLEAGAEIPGSFWGAPEAGLVGERVYFRDDTPVHSLLHELAHYVCMAPERRGCLDTDAGGDDAEECAVCYLEILLADALAPFDQARCLADMDAWGYSFRQGSARAWFRGDGREARAWLEAEGLIDRRGAVSFRRRGEPANGEPAAAAGAA